MKNNNLIGQIDLLSLVQATMENVNGRNSIVIPVDENPSIFCFTAKSGQPKAMLDIVVRETANSQWGNTHFVKASVGKSNREKYGFSKEYLQAHCPIIGNLKPLEVRESTVPQNAPVSAPQEELEDMPESTFNGF